MFQDVAVGFRRDDAILEDQHPTVINLQSGFGIRNFLSRKQRHPFSDHILDSSWALKGCLRIALPSITCFFYMQSPYREAMSPFVYDLQRHHRVENPSVSTTLSSGTELLSSSRCQFPTSTAPQHICWDQRNLSKGCRLSPSHISRVRPTTTHQCSASIATLAKNIFGSPQGAPWGTPANCPLSC